MEEVKKAQDKDGSLVAMAARVAKANKIDAAMLALYREVFDIVDFAVSKQWNSGAGCKGRGLCLISDGFMQIACGFFGIDVGPKLYEIRADSCYI